MLAVGILDGKGGRTPGRSHRTARAVHFFRDACRITPLREKLVVNRPFRSLIWPAAFLCGRERQLERLLTPLRLLVESAQVVPRREVACMVLRVSGHAPLQLGSFKHALIDEIFESQIFEVIDAPCG